MKCRENGIRQGCFLVVTAIVILTLSCNWLMRSSGTGVETGHRQVKWFLERSFPTAPQNEADVVVSRGVNGCLPARGISPPKKRDELPALLEERGYKTGVEVGVQEGVYAKVMRETWTSCEEYHIVDLWKHQTNYMENANVGNKEHMAKMNKAKTLLRPWKDTTFFHKMLSTKAAAMFAKLGKTFDFVYIDARHDYCGCWEDMEAYWPLVKPGGIMAGHDYNTAKEVAIPGRDWGLCGNGTRADGAVKGAVNDFFIPKGLSVLVAYYEQNYMTWLVLKPLC
eukprot:Selendium_serpulae@DN5395_c0_g1_i2.p1